MRTSPSAGANPASSVEAGSSRFPSLAAYGSISPMCVSIEVLSDSSPYSSGGTQHSGFRWLKPVNRNGFFVLG